MMRKKRFKRIIVLSDSEDSSDDDDFHQSHPRKRPVPRSAGQDNIDGFNLGPTPSLPDLISPPSDHDPDSTTSSDDIIIIDDEDPNRAGTSIYNNLTSPPSDHDPDSTTSSDDIIIVDDDDDEDSNTGESPIYNINLPSDSEESSTTEERTPLCNNPSCFLEDIISPTSIYVAHFQETKDELVERLYNLYNRTVFEDKLPEKLNILWNKRLTSSSGLCRHKIRNNHHRFSDIELSDKVCDSAKRVRSTLAHEMCHAACWLINGEARDNHGPLWQAYTRRVNDIHPELPEVTKHHSYTIHYNYNYQCSLCDKEFGRFRKIADNKCYCRRCGGRLRQLSTT